MRNGRRLEQVQEKTQPTFCPIFLDFLMSFAFPHYAIRDYFKNELHSRVRGFNTFWYVKSLKSNSNYNHIMQQHHSIVTTQYSDCVPIRNFPPQIPSPLDT